MHRFSAFLALGLLAAACSGTASAPDTTAAATPTVPTAPTTTASPPTTSGDEVAAASTTTLTLPETRDAGRRRGSSFPSLDDPRMIPVQQATWIDAQDVVLGLVAPDGEAHAYPVNQMTFHHIANTTVAGEPYLVTY